MGDQTGNKFGVLWQFNPPWSPHFGGIWERLIQDVKKCIKTIKNTPKHTPSEPTLRCALLEAVNRMNNRSLTHTPLDPESEEPLTPSFILGTDEGASLPKTWNENDLHSRWNYKRAHHMAKAGFARFVREYLPIIGKRSKWIRADCRRRRCSFGTPTERAS